MFTGITLKNAVTLAGVGVAANIIKDVPTLVFGKLKKQVTTEMTFTSQNRSFHSLMTWINKNVPLNFRSLKIRNGRYGDDPSLLSIGEGTHFFFYDNRPVFINLATEKNDKNYYESETVTLTILGRDKSLFDKLLVHVEECEKDTSKIDTYRYTSSWEFVRKLNKRSLDSVFIGQKAKTLLLESIARFLSKEQWYIENGIPYSLGILLYGPPGTGKTSLIKAVASHFGYDIYYISPSDLIKLQPAMASLPQNTLLVIEDIDSSYTVHDRKKDEEADLESGFTGFGISDLLNCLDGFFSPHGRILMATTNKLEKIDQAVLRPGRFDLKLEIGYVDAEIFSLFMNNFYPEHDCGLMTVKYGITVADLQQQVLLGTDANGLCEMVQ